MLQAAVKQNLYSVKIAAIRSRMARASRETKTIRPAARRKPAKPAAERPAGRRRRPAGETPYHHGDLHDALLAAAERVLERDGLPGLTLRAVAREAGVSHAAPTHHFGDLTGLLSELAAIGFRRFNETMQSRRETETHPLMKAMAQRQGLRRLCAGAPRHVRADVPYRAARHDPAVAPRGGDGLVRRTGERSEFSSATRSLQARRWKRCRSTRPQRLRGRGRWCTASPRCCWMGG